MLENKVRFICEVVEGSLIVSNRKKADLLAELKVKGYTAIPKEAVLEASVAGAVDHVEGSEETEEEETDDVAIEEKPAAGTTSKTIPGTEYDYLLAMSIGTLTFEKMQQLMHEKDTKKAEFDELTNTSSKSLWLRDLDALNHQLDVSFFLIFNIYFWVCLNLVFFVCVNRNKIREMLKMKLREGSSKKRQRLRVLDAVRMQGNLQERRLLKSLVPRHRLLLNRWTHQLILPWKQVKLVFLLLLNQEAKQQPKRKHRLRAK